MSHPEEPGAASDRAGSPGRVKSFDSWDGLRIAYREWGGRRNPPPVVLHHGFGVNAEANWLTTGVIDALTAAGRSVLAPDARGHGSSEKPHDPGHYGEHKMARDLAALIDLVGVERVDLVGYSMGAIVALLFASEDPRVRRLVVGGVGAGVVECGGVDRRAVSNDSIIQALDADDPATLEQPQARSFRMLAEGVGADRRALIAQARAVYRGGVELERIAAPTLVLAGDEDPLSVRPHVLAHAIPNATLRVVHGDHVGAIADPAFTQAIIDFLA